MRATKTLALVILAGSLSGARTSPSVERVTIRAFNVATAAGEAPEGCSEAIGKQAALALVRYCRWVSSATHPPCNTRNNCALIVEHIRGMCRSQPQSANRPLPCGEGMTAAEWRNISKMPAN
jgi:hypothetical protein